MSKADRERVPKEAMTPEEGKGSRSRWIYS